MVANLAEAGGHIVNVGMSSVGSSTLSYHSNFEPTLEQVNSGEWDYVVLQEHTLLPVIPHWVENSFYPKVAWFDSLITANGAETVLFMQQAYKNPNGEYCAFDHCSPAFYSHEEMHEFMQGSYYPLAESLDIKLVPLGDVWTSVLADNPAPALWGGDDLHASIAGSYLTACVFYLTLFNESPVGLSYTAGLINSEALMYQQYAAQFSSPRDVRVAITENEYTLTWTPVLECEYNVYSSSLLNSYFPDGWFLETHAPISETQWTSLISTEKKFFRIVSVIPENSLLTD
jgi:hypothetical protein